MTDTQGDGAAGRRVVLVSGAHRSGTTVLGELLSKSPGAAELWEPFNPDWGLRQVRDPYPFLPASTPPAPELAALARHVATGRSSWRAGSGVRRLPPVAHDVLRTSRKRVEWFRELRHAQTVVVKDPFLLLALGGFAAAVCPGPATISIKHPCAWVLSLTRVNWPAGRQARALLSQPEVREIVADCLPAQYLSVPDWDAMDPLVSAAVTWACLYRLVEYQRLAGAQLHMVTMEEFSSRPQQVLRSLYTAMQVAPAGDIGELARRYTAGGTVNPDRSVIHDLYRDGRKLANAWQDQMKTEQQNSVRSITEGVYDLYYASWDDPTVSRGAPAADRPAELH